MVAAMRKPTPPRSDFLDNPPNRLRELRIYAGLRQREVVARLPAELGVIRSNLSEWERGPHPIPAEVRAPLAEVFGLEAWELEVGVTAGPLTLPESWA